MALNRARGRLRFPPWTTDLLLAVWFVLISAQRLAVLAPGGEAGFDGRLYCEATRAWLAGRDPWDVSLGGIGFAASPPSLLPMVPFALLPHDLAAAAIIVLGLVGMTLAIRRLRMPLWFLAFPPFVDGLWNANPDVLLLPLLLAGTVGAATAGFVKVYALVPAAILGRWRPLGLCVGALLLTVPILPWGPYLARLPEILERLAMQSSGGMSATAWPILVPIAVAALLVVGRARGAWLAIPVLWPSTQWYYATIAAPAFVRRTPLACVAAALLAVPIPGLPVASAAVLAVDRVVERRAGVVTGQGSRSAG